MHQATRDHLQGRDLAIDYPRADFDARIEERRIDDHQLIASWGRCIYRIALAARRPTAPPPSAQRTWRSADYDEVAPPAPSVPQC